MESHPSPSGDRRAPAAREALREGAGEATRAAILRATVEVLCREGVHGARVEEIAGAAGVSPGLLNYHFGNRQALLRAGLIAGLRLRARPEDYANADASEILSGGMVGRPGFDPDHVPAPVGAAAVVSGRWWRIRSDALREAVFDAEVRSAVADATDAWVGYLAERLPGNDPLAEKAERATTLVALVDGLRQRVASGLLSADAAAATLTDAISRDAERYGRVR